VAAAAERSAAALPHGGEPAAAPAALATAAGSAAAADAGAAGLRQGGAQGCAAVPLTPALGDGAPAGSPTQARAPLGTAGLPVLEDKSAAAGSGPSCAAAAGAESGSGARARAVAGLAPASWPPAPAGEHSLRGDAAVAAALEAPAQRPSPVLARGGPAAPAAARAAGDPAAARACGAPARADAAGCGAPEPEAALALEGGGGPELLEAPLRLSVSGIELDALPGSCAG